MRFTCALAMNPPEQLVPLAVTAEECGFSSVALPDSIFYSERVSAQYPYTPDGSRMWTEETPFTDALCAASAIGAATSTIRSYPQVLKLGSRHPVPLAKQVGSVANLTANRFGLGLGIGWNAEECRWCGIENGLRGKRTDEAIEVLRLLLAGGMAEYHGEYFDFDRLQMSPAPSEPVPIYIGGHSPAALRRAARLSDGWTSAMMGIDQLREVVTELRRLRAEYGRDHLPFEVQAVCVDRFGLDGYREQAEAGVTDAIAVPWLTYGVGFDAPLAEKQDGIKRFADDVINRMELADA